MTIVIEIQKQHYKLAIARETSLFAQLCMLRVLPATTSEERAGEFVLWQTLKLCLETR